MEIFWILIIGIALIVIITIANQRKKGTTINSLALDIRNKGFNVTKQVTDSNNNFSILVDDTNNKWAVLNSRTHSADIYDYRDLIEYEVLEDGDSIVKGRVGSAIVGGVLFGGIGAVAGASRKKKIKANCNSMSVRILTNDFNRPQYVIQLLSGQTKTDSIIYQGAKAKAQEITSLLAIVKARAEMQ